MSAFEKLLTVPAIHRIDVMRDRNNGSVILSQQPSENGCRMVVQIPSHALDVVAEMLALASKANAKG